MISDYLFMVTREEVFSPLPSKSPSPSSEFSFAGEEKTKLVRQTDNTKHILRFDLIYCSLRRIGNIHVRTVLGWKLQIDVEKNKRTDGQNICGYRLSPALSHEPRKSANLSYISSCPM